VTTLTAAQRLKFVLLAEGLTISAYASEVLDGHAGGRALTPADYASTSGLILALEDDVWVNAPIRRYNPNFVEQPATALLHDGASFLVQGPELASRAAVWLPPRYHRREQVAGRPIEHFVFTHGDRVRLSPIRGCAMKCRFCNIPYEDPYETKPLTAMIASLRHAFADPLQPAHHALISGGTPVERDFVYLQQVYRDVLIAFPEHDIDIMMVPVDGLLDVEELRDLGVGELSINLELSDGERARELMPQKHRYGWDRYLRFIEYATSVLGPGRVRSMVMVGLEPLEQTVAGVERIIEHGGVPVLSPFRPDPATPLADLRPLDASELEETYLAAVEIASAAGVNLGPSCVVCTHNTLTFCQSDGTASYRYPPPVLV
jgi:hypothetical protein